MQLYPLTRQIFLETGPSRAFTSESLKPPNPECSVCNQASATVKTDPARATLKDLVHTVLQEKLGYADDVTVRHESTVLYDPEFDDNLGKTFAELSLRAENLLTVVDEKQKNPRVDLSLTLVTQYVLIITFNWVNLTVQDVPRG